MRAMNVVAACVLCAVAVTGCGTVAKASRGDVLPDSTVAAMPSTPSVVPDAPLSAAAIPDATRVMQASSVVATVTDEEAATPISATTLGRTTPIVVEPLTAARDEPTSDASTGRRPDILYADDRFDDTVALLMQSARSDNDDAIPEEYDPWEPFNERMFEVNRQLDRYVLKPAATAYDKVMPDRLQNMIANGFDNIRFVPRFVNSLLQAKWGGAGREAGRFFINSTLGIAGLFDIAKQEFGLEKSREDFGQTLGKWGAGPGPFLILPLLPPLTVRDGVGFVVDGAMNPLNYVLPFFWDRLGMAAGDAVNDRSLNLELYQGFEETVIDMYSAVRHGYLQRREQMIKE